jgi:shikimate dehydrogenase
VVGNPPEQVMASALMNRLFVDRTIDAVLVPVKAETSSPASIVEGLKSISNLGGILVAVPQKFAACRHTDRLTERAELAQWANACRCEGDGSWSAGNFDRTGLVAGLLNVGHEVSDKAISLVGASGAGVSIGPTLMMAGAAHLIVSDISEQRKTALAGRIAQRWPGEVRTSPVPVIHEIDIIINATPIGLRPEDPLPFEVEGLPPHAVVADIIMKPAETRLLAAARARGLCVNTGLHMLTEQIELYRQFFRRSSE